LKKKKRKESKPNWEKVEAAKQFFSLRRGTITTFLKKYKSEKHDTKDEIEEEKENENENEDGNVYENGNGHVADQSDAKSSSSTVTTTTTAATTTTPTEMQAELKDTNFAENNKAAEATTVPTPELNEIQLNKKEEPPVVQEILKVEDTPTILAPAEQKSESVSPPIEEPKAEEPQQIKSPEEPINTGNS